MRRAIVRTRTTPARSLTEMLTAHGFLLTGPPPTFATKHDGALLPSKNALTNRLGRCADPVEDDEMKRAFVIALTAALLLTQSPQASAVVPLGPDFHPKGEVRMASLTASNPVTTTANFNTGFVPIPGLGLPISIPRGKTADVKILFTGEMNSADAAFVSAVVDGSPASPGIVQAFWGVGGGATSQSANFTASLGEGDHAIQMQWGGLGGQQFMSLRSIIVIVNLRRNVPQRQM